MVVPTQSVLKIAPVVVVVVEITDPENSDQPARGSVLFIDLLLCIRVRPEVGTAGNAGVTAETLDYHDTLYPGTGR